MASFKGFEFLGRRGTCALLCLSLGLSLGMTGCQDQDPQEEDSQDKAGSPQDESPSESAGETESSENNEEPGTEPSPDASSEEPESSSGGEEEPDPSASTETDKPDDSSDPKDSGETDSQAPDPDDCPDKIPEGPKDCEGTTLEAKLRCIPGMTVKTKDGKTFDLSFEQPVNHADKSAGTFTQRLHLRHTSADAPLIMQTSGYTLSTRRSELAQLFSTNVLSIEHRFFNRSTPKAPADWSQLNIKNSADDFHRIYKALKWLYPKPWVSTGASKGGETVLFHRHFHHCDVQGTVAYVAPLVMGQSDDRFVDFMNKVGGNKLKKCRNDLRAFQRLALKRRSAMLSRMQDSEYKTLGGAAVALEHAVIELPFVFFQYKSPSTCNAVPSSNASDQDVYNYLKNVGQLEQFKDRSLAPFEAYYYQAANELGTPGEDLDPLDDLLKHADTYNIDAYIPRHKVTFDDTAMPKVQDWIKRKGQNIMLIYGGLDPWTAAQVELGDAKDSFSFSAPQGNHQAGISSLDRANEKKAKGIVGRWLKTKAKLLRSKPSMDWMLDAKGPPGR